MVPAHYVHWGSSTLAHVQCHVRLLELRYPTEIQQSRSILSIELVIVRRDSIVDATRWYAELPAIEPCHVLRLVLVIRLFLSLNPILLNLVLGRANAKVFNSARGSALSRTRDRDFVAEPRQFCRQIGYNPFQAPVGGRWNGDERRRNNQYFRLFPSPTLGSVCGDPT